MNLTQETIRGTIIFLVLGAVALGFIVFTVRNAEEPKRLMVKWVFTLPILTLAFLSVSLFGPMGPFVIVGCAVVLSFLWTPHLGALFSKPLTSAFDGGSTPPDPQPLYSIAQSKQKKGQYVEAVAEIRKQLARFPTDVEGHLLLAQILAEDLKDLPGAELTIYRFVAQPNHAPKNVAFALYALADWHLRYSQDREGARRALEKIIELLPDTEFSAGAAQRIAHLGSPEMLVAPHERRKFTVREGPKNLGLLDPQEHLKPPEVSSEQMANAYVKHLEQHPLDTEAREKLAVLYADHYKRLDLATAELEQLISSPNLSSKLIVHWLNLLADLQIRSGANYDVVSQTLHRIIDLDPKVAAAELARNRLAILRLELKSQTKPGSVKLGEYEQNIGLKRHGGR